MDKILFVIIFTSVNYVTCERMGSKMIMAYLNTFGYLSSEDMESENTTSVAIAIGEFQSFADINVTGQMDRETERMMLMPRCGMKDIIKSKNMLRPKRYDLHDNKWDFKALTYQILNHTNKLKKSVLESEIRRAFSIWSDHTDLTFQQKKYNPNIEISFLKNSRLNGPHNVLAYASYPRPSLMQHINSYAHFDISEEWTAGTNHGINLLQVAAHEIGHMLGLRHSKIRKALMTPFYLGYIKNVKLHNDDITGIQALYGKKTKVKNVELCNTHKIDTIFPSFNGQTYVFIGSHYWSIKLKGNTIHRKGGNISKTWPGLPANIDAALAYGVKTYFFKGHQYWRYEGTKMDRKYPKNISDGFPGLPNNIDAAMVWTGNGKIYFFKGSKYWRLDSMNIGHVYGPKPIYKWKGVPPNLSAAFQYNFKTYFFKDRDYYEFDDKTNAVKIATPTYPRSTKYWWFNCKSALK